MTFLSCATFRGSPIGLQNRRFSTACRSYNVIAVTQSTSSQCLARNGTSAGRARLRIAWTDLQIRYRAMAFSGERRLQWMQRISVERIDRTGVSRQAAETDRLAACAPPESSEAKH